MNELEEENEVVVEAEPKRFNCDNCEDSGKECYVCGAGRQVA